MGEPLHRFMIHDRYHSDRGQNGRCCVAFGTNTLALLIGLVKKAILLDYYAPYSVPEPLIAAGSPPCKTPTLFTRSE